MGTIYQLTTWSQEHGFQVVPGLYAGEVDSIIGQFQEQAVNGTMKFWRHEQMP